MRLKRYVAMSMRAALARIRAEEGEDAILLAHRPLGEGVEVIAATAAEDLWDLVPHVDEASAPPGGATASASTSAPTSASTSAPTSTAGAVPTQAGRPLDLARFLAEQAESREAESREAEPVPPRPALTPLSDPALARLQQDLSSFRGIVEQQLAGLALADPALRPAGRAESLARLLALGFAPPLARELALALPAEGAAAAAWSLCQAELVRRLPVAPEVLLAEGGVAAFLGPTGAGKTTVLAMIAARHALIYGSDSVALLTTDDRRIGAQEELKVLSRLLGIPLWLATEAHGLEKVLQGLLGRRLVLVDTPGRCSPGALATLAALPPTALRYLVCPATMQPSALDRSLDRALDHALAGRAAAPFAGCILTKTDEAVELGPVLSFLIHHGLGIAYVTAGPRIPEDLTRPTASALVEWALAGGDGIGPPGSPGSAVPTSWASPLRQGDAPPP